MKLINPALVFSIPPSNEWRRVHKTIWNDGLVRSISSDSMLEDMPVETAVRWAEFGIYSSEVYQLHLLLSYYLQTFPSSHPVEDCFDHSSLPGVLEKVAGARSVILTTNGEKSLRFSEEWEHIWNLQCIASMVSFGAESKLLGPNVLLHVDTEVLAKKGRKFLPGVIMYISSNSNHPWRLRGVKAFLLDRIRLTVFFTEDKSFQVQIQLVGQKAWHHFSAGSQPSSNERLF